ncbi:Uncharacterized protein DAT39_011809, partial [Clarias magur]
FLPQEERERVNKELCTDTACLMELPLACLNEILVRMYVRSRRCSFVQHINRSVSLSAPALSWSASRQ